MAETTSVHANRVPDRPPEERGLPEPPMKGRGGVKKMTPAKLKWYEQSYLWGILKGMKQTMRHFLKRPDFTVQYPDTRWPLPPGYRGAPVLVTGEDGNERCVACLMCMFVCPPQAIYIEAEETALDKERRPEVFDIDFGRCIFCGYCEEACPEIAIVLKDEFELASFTREGLIYPKDKLLDLGKKDRESFVYPISGRGPTPPRERGPAAPEPPVPSEEGSR